MKEDNKVIKTNSLLYEEFAVDDETTIDTGSLIGDPLVTFPCTAEPSGCCCVTETVSFTTCDPQPIKEITIAQDVNSCSGKVLKVHVNLTNVCCPSKVNVAVAVAVCRGGNLIALKVKTINIGSGNTTAPVTCTDVSDGDFCFALPGRCNPEDLTVRVIANYDYSSSAVTCPPCPTTAP